MDRRLEQLCERVTLVEGDGSRRRVKNIAAAHTARASRAAKGIITPSRSGPLADCGRFERRHLGQEAGRGGDQRPSQGGAGSLA